jgi:hypothetical protein
VLLKCGATSRDSLTLAAKLCLTTRAFEEHHKVTRYLHCDFPAHILFDKSKR